jgi:mRNA-degrading endonuclease toxin of MazEF toxin-antitoxin module
VILTRDEAIAGVDKLVAAPTTRTVRNLVSEVQVGPDDGLRLESVISLDNTTLVRKSLLTDRITTLGPEKMAAVCRALNAATGC